jgi:uncharacterized membrane protein YeaQ/YmgE (transglycosylase-associated protein family)
MGTILYVIIVGGIAGWLAGLLIKGRGSGLIINVLIGIVGAMIGNWVFQAAGWTSGDGIVANIFVAFVGASLLLAIFRLIRS